MPTAKSPVYLVPFSHLDLFWAGNRDECLTRGNEVIRTALRLLRKYPEYRFLIESVNFFEFFCESCPDAADELKRFIQEGRVEVIPMRSIIYTQLPAGETLIRNYLRGHQILMKILGSHTRIATLSDIPGVTPQLPQIVKKCGFAGLLLSHGTPPHTDCVEYVALDGTVLPTYAPIHYGRAKSLFGGAENFEIMCQNEEKVEAELGGMDYPQLCQFGADLMVIEEHVVENFRRWNESGRRPFFFSTLTEYFEKHFHAQKRISGEIPSLWPNVESSWPDLWPKDLQAESAVFEAEFFDALTPQFRKKEFLPEIWNWLLDAMDHNQNGMGGERADLEKKALKESARLAAERLARERAMRIAAQVGSPDPRSYPIVIFNRLSWRRHELVHARTGLYHHGAMHIEELNEHNFRLKDSSGRECPFRLVKFNHGSADTIELEFTADVPAFGAAVYYIEVCKPQTFDTPFELTDPREQERRIPGGPAKPVLLKNRFWQLTINRVTGELTIAGADGKVYADHAGIVGLEETRGDYICHMELTGRKIPAVVNKISEVKLSPVSAEVELEGTVYGIHYTQTIRLAADSPELCITNRIDWKHGSFVRLEQAFPLTEKADIHYGVPFGMVHYPDTIYKNGLDFRTIVSPERGHNPDDLIKGIRLASPFVSVNGLTIAADHRMWEFSDQEVRNCMLRGIGWCSGGFEIFADGTRKDFQRPPDGSYICHYRLTQGLDVKGAWSLNAPLYPVGVGSCLPGPAELILPQLPETTGTTVIGSNVKGAEDGNGIVVRLFESEGKEAEIDLPAGTWFETDMLEQDPVPLSEKLHFHPFEIKTLLRRFS